MMKHEIPAQLLPAIGEQTELEIEGYQTPSYQGEQILKSPDDADRPFSNSRYPHQLQRAHLTPVTPVKRDGDDDDCSPEDAQTYPDGAVLITEVDESRERDGADLYSDDVSSESDHIADDDDEDYDSLDHYRRRRVNIGNTDVIENDEQWDTDLENDDSREEDDLTGRIEYRQICDHLGVVPATYFLRHIQDSAITMRYHGIGAMGAKAIALVLRNVVTLERLNLQGNGMGGDGAQAVARMLQENEYIADVNLSENNLGCNGLEHVCRMLSNNIGVKKMDMSDNGFDDSDVPWIVDTLDQNKCLKTLKLAKNRFGETGGEQLGPAIGGNDVLEVLDLSWNHMRLGGGLAIARGLQENVRLKVCLLAWNGLGPEGGIAIAEALAVNGSILELDITGNRLDMDTAIRMAKALSVNDALTVLRMGNNVLTTAGAIALITAILHNDSSAIEELDITDVPVEDEFMRGVDEVRKKKPDFRVRHGVVLRTGNAPEDQKKRHLTISTQSLPPVAVLDDERIVVNDARLLEILRRHDPDDTFSINPEQFISALDELAVPYDKKQIEDAIHRITLDESGRIYIGDFLNKDHRPVSCKERSFAEHDDDDVDERKEDICDVNEVAEQSSNHQDEDEDEEEDDDVAETEEENDDENEEED